MIWEALLGKMLLAPTRIWTINSPNRHPSCFLHADACNEVVVAKKGIIKVLVGKVLYYKAAIASLQEMQGA